MNARMLVVAMMLAPGLAMANGPKASGAPSRTGHINVPAAVYRNRTGCLPRKHTSPERFDTPVDKLPDWSKGPDWDAKEAQDRADQGKHPPGCY